MPTEPRFLADEMLGRLARYLRILGYDTEYARGSTDAAIRTRALAESRTLLTRDRALGAQVPDAVTLVSLEIRGQLGEMARVIPGFRLEPSFRRCTLCNGSLEPEGLSLPFPPATPIYRCLRCGHRYWEGSHTKGIRDLLAGLRSR